MTPADLDVQIETAKRFGHSLERFRTSSQAPSAEAPIQRVRKKVKQGTRGARRPKTDLAKTQKKRTKPQPDKSILKLVQSSGGRGGRGRPNKTDRLYEKLEALADESRKNKKKRKELSDVYNKKLKKDKSLSRDEQDQIIANRHRFTKDVRVTAKKPKGQVRGTGQDELHETSQTPEVFAADAGIIPKKKISIGRKKQPLKHLHLHRYNRSSTGHIFFPTGGAHTPGLKTRGRINSKGNAELDKARTEAAKRSHHTSTTLHRVVKAHLDNTAKPKDFTKGKFEGEDVWGNDLQDPEVQKLHARETKRKRTRLKVGAKKFLEEYAGESDSEVSDFSDYDEDDLSSDDEVLKKDFARDPRNLIHLHRYDAFPVKKTSKKKVRKTKKRARNTSTTSSSGPPVRKKRRIV